MKILKKKKSSERENLTLEREPPLIAVFGGTFDPVHLGHLYVAEQVYQKLPVNEIRFIPCYHSPTRPLPIATPTQRLAMLKLATANHSHYLVDDREIERQGLSYTVDTLKELKKEQKENIFALILGADVFANFNQWRNWENILTLSHLILVDRPTPLRSFKPPQPQITQLLANKKIETPKELLSKNAGNILKLNIASNAVSSTTVREKLFKKQEVNGMLPASVLAYITQRHLYM